MGVRVMTFDRLYAECLNAAGEAYTELSEPVQYRLIRSILDEVPLEHYQPLIPYPGFVQSLQGLFAELKAARVHPEAFARAVQGLGDESRLSELAQLYAAYQQHLQQQGWADRAGLGWLAVEALEDTLRAPAVGRDWPLLVVDGFGSFTPIQVALLKTLSGRVGRLTITLTGTRPGPQRPLVHTRFERTRVMLEGALGITAQPLPAQQVDRSPLLAHLEAGLFRSGEPATDERGSAAPGNSAVELIEAPDRASEVRAALRWIKARVVQDGMPLASVALLARDITPYYAFIVQTADEFGLPVRLVDGLPLRSNPAIAALLDLLSLMLPCSEDNAEPALPRRQVVEAWRSPYFNWFARPDEETAEPIGIVAGDADALDLAARWGKVIQGQSQWDQVLSQLSAHPVDAAAGDRGDDEERGIPPGIPLGPAARVLGAKFERFVRRLTPAAGQQSYNDWIRWIEGLIGPDPTLQAARYPLPEEPTALQVVARARENEDSAERDAAALEAFKDVLRGLVWAEDALPGALPVNYVQFLEELAGAVEATQYRLPIHPAREELLVADVIQARGLPFRAVAVLGLAEGEFPATVREDPFLRDTDRKAMRDAFDLQLESSAESAEIEFFYETITRPSQRLLLTRPRLADNGAQWQASPYWEEVCRLTDQKPRKLTSELVLSPAAAASWPELMESIAAHPDLAVYHWVQQTQPERIAALERTVHALKMRRGREASELDGELSVLADTFARRFRTGHVWSATRLETYRSCPFGFFVGKVLYLERWPEPVKGLDARQLGSIYHRILEKVYQKVTDRGDVQQLLEALPAVGNAVLDAAPQQDGFRESAWWDQTREEILENVRRSLQALADQAEGYTPYGWELRLGFEDQTTFMPGRGNDRFRLHGYIDRVDCDGQGQLRVIDYKTGSPSAYSNRAVAEGKKLQLPLYALAARDALGLGKPADGFYWHVQHAEPSSFTLRTFEGGPGGAMSTAIEKALEAVHGARGGHFVPRPPDEGCPDYCPAASFCWHLRPVIRG
jgi:ATP-dependent helicase/DNAse subunit B